MNATIIVCTYNRARDLDATLAALRQVQLPHDFSVDALIVDNGSTDETPNVVAVHRGGALEVSYLHEARRGKGHAYNRGLAESRGEIAIFTDDDVRPHRDWIRCLCAPIREGRADAVAGAIAIAPHLIRPWMTPLHRSLLAATDDWDWSKPSAMNGANMAFAKYVLAKVPAFDPALGPGALGFWDEALFSRQLAQAGFRIAGAPGAIVEHHFSPDRLTHAAFADRATREGRSLAYVAWHWGHVSLDPFVRLRYWRKRLGLSLRRFLHRESRVASEAPPNWELHGLRSVGYFQQLAKEQRKPRNYSREGLRRTRPLSA